MNPDDRTTGERIADAVAKFGGSWKFIIFACLFVFSWATYNAVAPPELRFDSFPFTLLNLFLSLVAALQAPFILMSQRRAETKSEEHHRRTLRGIKRLVQKDIEIEKEILEILKNQNKDVEQEILALLRAGTGNRTPTS